MPPFLAPVSIGLNPASVGNTRFPALAGPSWRNNANTGDGAHIRSDASDSLYYTASAWHRFDAGGVGEVFTIRGTQVLSTIPWVTTGSYIAAGATPAQTGVIRLPNNTGMYFRNAANTGDWGSVLFSTTNRLQYEGNAGHQWYISGVLAMQHINAGLDVIGYLAAGTNPAGSGTFRIPSQSYVRARNAANTADIDMLLASSADGIQVGGTNATGVDLVVNGSGTNDFRLVRSGVPVLTYASSNFTINGGGIATTLSASGLTGATAASRIVGATTSGAPASGTFAKGDVVVDQSGKIWINTTAGSPGTFTDAGGSFWSRAKWLVD